MANEVIIRRSPVALIRTLALIELLALVAYILSLGGGSAKYDFYSKLPVAAIFSYQTAKFIFLSGMQLLITIFAFLSWYFERYIVRPNIIIHENGVIFKNKEAIQLNEAPSVNLNYGWLGRLLRYGSIELKTSPKKRFLLSRVSSPKTNFEIISKLVRASGRDISERPDIQKILKETEHEQLEFKSSLRFDRKTGQVNRDLEKAAFKSIAAFLNSSGGRLIIGVSDNHGVLGLKDDYETLKRQDPDGFESHFTQVFNSMLGPEFRHLARLWIETVGGQEICVIDVAESARPVYLKTDNSEHFYVRTGNITTSLKLSEVEAYSLARWPDRAHFS